MIEAFRVSFRPLPELTPGGTPGWWVKLFMTRPRRREEAHLCRLLEQGSVDGDEVVFPLGNHKPHKDYW